MHQFGQNPQIRNERIRQREFERSLKEQVRRSEQELAKLEVAAFENRLEVLLSVHKECGETWDWKQLASALPPAPPPLQPLSSHEIDTRLRVAMQRASGRSLQDSVVDSARDIDVQAHSDALLAHAKNMAEYIRMQTLARKVIVGDSKAYKEVLNEFSPFTEISDLGSSVRFLINGSRVVEGILKVNGLHAIPAEMITLTSTGRLSTRAMPRTRFHSIYQDHICACMLRVVREVFALLPAECVLVTCITDYLNTSTGRTSEVAVLSAAFPRFEFHQLCFDSLDPSDAVESFLHRGDFKASRKTDAFQPIVPLDQDDLTFLQSTRVEPVCDLATRVEQKLEQLRAWSQSLNSVDSELEGEAKP